MESSGRAEKRGFPSGRTNKKGAAESATVLLRRGTRRGGRGCRRRSRPRHGCGCRGTALDRRRGIRRSLRRLSRHRSLALIHNGRRPHRGRPAVLTIRRAAGDRRRSLPAAGRPRCRNPRPLGQDRWRLRANLPDHRCATGLVHREVAHQRGADRRAAAQRVTAADGLERTHHHAADPPFAAGRRPAADKRERQRRLGGRSGLHRR